MCEDFWLLYLGKRGAKWSQHLVHRGQAYLPPNYALPRTAPTPKFNSSKMSGVVKLVDLACYLENGKGRNEKEVSCAGENKSKSRVAKRMGMTWKKTILLVRNSVFPLKQREAAGNISGWRKIACLHEAL